MKLIANINLDCNVAVCCFLCESRFLQLFLLMGKRIISTIYVLLFNEVAASKKKIVQPI